MSDIGRHELAMEIIANVEGKEVDTAALGHPVGGEDDGAKSAEHIELLLYGERWRDWQPLDRYRACTDLPCVPRLGYCDKPSDKLGLGRFRDKLRRQDGRGKRRSPGLRGRDRSDGG